MTPEAAEALLKACYLGPGEPAELRVNGLLDLAVQYEVPGLAAAVAGALATGLSPENVRERLAALRAHKDDAAVAPAAPMRASRRYVPAGNAVGNPA